MSVYSINYYLYEKLSGMPGKTCLDCGEKLRGRSDKKFCSDHCRNNYNNRINRDTNLFVRNIHNLLRRNRRILLDLYESGNRRVHRDALTVSGYNFGFFTHLVESEGGSVSWYCYEYGLTEIDDGFVQILINISIIDV